MGDMGDMGAIEQYIKSKLSDLKTLSLDLSYRYAYDDKTNFHIVEMVPYSLMENDAIFNIIFDIQSTIYSNYPDTNFIYSGVSPYNDMGNLIDSYNSERVITSVNKNIYVKSSADNFMIFNESNIFSIAA